MPLPPPDTTGAACEPSRDNPLPGAYLTLALLLLINLFNYIDRQLLIAVLPKIEESLTKNDPTFASESKTADAADNGQSAFNEETGSKKTKKKLGFLTTAFMVSFLIFSPIFGRLAEGRSRWLIVGIGVMLWSLASGTTGLAKLYLVILATRCFAGIGEAAYGPVAPTMLSDSFPLHARSRVLGWLYLAMPIGVATGYIFGGFVADMPGLDGEGWRWAFYLMVVPGLLLSLLCLRMRDPPRHVHAKVRLRDWAVLVRTPSYVLNTLGMTAMMFAVGGVGSWLNYYLYEREARFEWGAEAIRSLPEGKDGVPDEVVARLQPLSGQVFVQRWEFERRLEGLLAIGPTHRIAQGLGAQGVAPLGTPIGSITQLVVAEGVAELRVSGLAPAELAQYKNKLVAAARQPKLAYINLMCGLMGVTAGILGILIGSFIADRLRRRLAGAYFLVSGWSLVAALPCFLFVILSPLPWTWGFIFLTTLFLFFGLGPTSAILANVAHPSMRPAAFALNLFCIHAFGDAISPFVIGAIADRFSLQIGFIVVSLILLLGGVLWLWGARYLQRDIELAPTRLDMKKDE